MQKQIFVSCKNTPIISPRGVISAWNMSVDLNDLYSSSLDPKRLAKLRTVLGSEKKIWEVTCKSLSQDFDVQNEEIKGKKKLLIDIEPKFIEDEKPSALFNKNTFEEYTEYKINEILQMDDDKL